MEKIVTKIKEFFIGFFAVLAAFLGFMFLRQKSKTEQLEKENFNQEIEIEKAKIIRETTSSTLNDLINTHNEELRRKKQDE